MPRNFNLVPTATQIESPRFWLQIAVVLLGILNLVAVFLLIDPPGGTRSELRGEAAQIKGQIDSTNRQASRLESVAQKVQLGSDQSDAFLKKFILPKRLAYASVISELQRISHVSGMIEKDATYSEEPIEGSPDLTLLGSSANYEGSYENLRRFLYEVDRSPYLIMLESLQVAPQQRGNQVTSNIKFQAVIQDDATISGPARGEP